MFKKNNFFKNFFISSKIYNQNIKKTKNIFFSFKEDFKNGEIPFLESYTKDYKFEFSNKILQKYSKYKNIVVIGMKSDTPLCRAGFANMTCTQEVEL